MKVKLLVWDGRIVYGESAWSRVLKLCNVSSFLEEVRSWHSDPTWRESKGIPIPCWRDKLEIDVYGCYSVVFKTIESSLIFDRCVVKCGWNNKHYKDTCLTKTRICLHIRWLDQYTSSTLIGGKGGPGLTSLPSHYIWGTNRVYKWTEDGCKVYMNFYMASNGSCFTVTCTIFKNHLLEVGLTQNRETMTLRTLLTTVDFTYLSCVRTHMIRNSLK